MAAEVCDATQIRYKGNGVTKLFTFPFQYLDWDDVQPFLWNTTTKEYENCKSKTSKANATTINFFEPPPSPEAGDPEFNVIIARVTGIEDMRSIFYPGSSIRAEDLNQDFDQLKYAIQEGQCEIYDVLDEISRDFWGKKSIRGRQNYLTTEQPYDTIYKQDQESGYWANNPDADQNAIPTSGAVSARLDPYVQDVLPDVPNTTELEQQGKWWINTEDCWQSYWNDQAKAWVAYTNTGPRGEQGVIGEEGPPGPQGPPLKIVGYVAAGDWADVEPADPQPGDIWICEGTITNFPGGGTPIAEDAITWNGEIWINTGPIGIEGPKGDPGTGIQGPPGPPPGLQTPSTAATNVPNNSDGSLGTAYANVTQDVNWELFFTFGIPVGEKGEKGEEGTTFVMKGQVATSADLPTTGNEVNDTYQTLDTGHLWTWTEAGAWMDIGAVAAGPQGPPGPVIDITTLPTLPTL